jgi:DNA repair protein RadA/Sms
MNPGRSGSTGRGGRSTGGRRGGAGVRKGARSEHVYFLCSDCGDSFPQWFGKCPSCQAWNTLHEYRPPSDDEPVRRAEAGGSLLQGGFARPGRTGGTERATPAPRSGAEPGADPTRRAGDAGGGPWVPPGSAVPPGSGVQAVPAAHPGRSSRSRGRRVARESAPAGPRGAGGSDASVERSPASPSFDDLGGRLVRLDEVPLDRVPRVVTGIGELDRILGGGLVPGSVVLLGGDPGIGKSTLLLQAAGSLVRKGARALYVSGEESAAQIRLRAERLEGLGPELLLHTETDLELVAAAVERIDPQVLVVDSIQTAFLPAVASAPGSVAQVRESALALIQLAKRREMAVLLVGHVTKEGTLAGPKTLEHMVDTVLYMEGERYQHYRILRSAKNRFGSVNEIGVFEMVDRGLREVPNPSQIFLSEHTAGAVGSVVSASLEGTRALLMEIQSLVNPTRYGLPQRLSTGYEGRRLEILLAVLAKRGGLDTSQHDVFVNVAGGLRVIEPGVDLGVLLAVASSRKERPPHPDMVALGEIGLGGEVRRVSHPERRIAEAARLGYGWVLLPEANTRDLGSRRDGLRLVGVGTVVEALHEGLQPGA